MKLALVVLVAIALTAGVLFVFPPWGGGTEVVYALTLPPGFTGTPKAAAEETARILLARARSLGVEATAVATPDGRVRVRFVDVKPEEFEPYRDVFEKKGRLELLASAPPEVQARFEREGKLPPGFRVVEGPLVVVDRPVVTGSDVTATLIGSSGQWTVAVELDYDARARYDSVAKGIFSREPPGVIAVVMDGTVASASAHLSGVYADRIELLGGKGEIETRMWAAIVGDELPCPVRPLEVRTFRGRP
jgi:hypothetical protein